MKTNKMLPTHDENCYQIPGELSIIVKDWKGFNPLKQIS